MKNIGVSYHDNTIAYAGRGQERGNYLNVVRSKSEADHKTGYDAKGKAVDDIFIPFDVGDVADLGPYDNCQTKEGE